MKDNSKLKIVVLVLLTIIVVVISFVFNITKQKEEDINIVKNYSDFYTVNSCIYRAITYISTKDSKNLMLVLNDEYKKKNNITEKESLKLFENIKEDYTFESKKMYYVNINSDITKYYVYGNIYLNTLYDHNSLQNDEKNDIYFIVYLDTSSNTFSIEPYTGEIFKSGDKYEK